MLSSSQTSDARLTSRRFFNSYPRVLRTPSILPRVTLCHGGKGGWGGGGADGGEGWLGHVGGGEEYGTLAQFWFEACGAMSQVGGKGGIFLLTLHILCAPSKTAVCCPPPEVPAIIHLCQQHKARTYVRACGCVWVCVRVCVLCSSLLKWA